MNARALALAALTRWREGRQFADAIIQQSLGRSSLSTADRALATELFYGVLRNLTALDFLISEIRSGALDHASRDLLRLGLYQLFHTRMPAHAAVFETVQLSGKRNRGLINGVLRSATRQETEMRAALAAQPLAIRASHPEFLLQRWDKAFGEDATRALCDWNNSPAPIYARVNRLRDSVEEFAVAHSEAAPLDERANFVRLTSVPLDALAAGQCYIQDPSTAVACELLDPQPGETILDACAAPGGKSAYLAELMTNRGSLVVCDRDPARVKILRENLDRLGVGNATVVRHDWTSPTLPAELGGTVFDRILLDAPCTNTGVMRRRIDVRWRLQPEDFTRMPNEQLTIARAVLPLLKPGGTFVYSTCSLDRDENEAVVAELRKEFPSLQLDEERSDLPFRDKFDGAFAARFRHLASATPNGIVSAP